MKIKNIFRQYRKNAVQKLIDRVLHGKQHNKLARRQQSMAAGTLLGGILSAAVIAILAPVVRKQLTHTSTPQAFLKGLKAQLNVGLSQLKDQTQNQGEHMKAQAADFKERYSKQTLNKDHGNGRHIPTMGEV